jgi:hypothetical protein
MTVIDARPPHRVVSTQEQPVRIVRAVQPALLLPERYGEALEQGSAYTLEYPPLSQSSLLSVTAATAPAAGGGVVLTGTGPVPGILSVTATGAVAAGGAVALTGAGHTEILSQQVQTTQQNLTGSNPTQRAESFELSGAETIGSVALKLDKVGSPVDNVQLEIQSNATDRPSTTTLRAATAISGSTLTTSQAWYEFTLTLPLSLSAGTQYWIVFSRSGGNDGVNYYRWGRSSSDIEATWLTSLNSGGWSAGTSTFDYTFILYTPA